MISLTWGLMHINGIVITKQFILNGFVAQSGGCIYIVHVGYHLFEEK